MRANSSRAWKWLRWALAMAALIVLAAPKLASYDFAATSRLERRAERASGSDGAGEEGTDVGERGRGSAAVRVGAVVVAPAPIAEIVTSVGTLLPGEAVDLQPEVSGRIARLDFDEGAHVKKGDLLVKLDASELEAQQAAALLELELAERRERRTTELVAQGYVRAEEHDAARNALEVQRARIRLTAAQIAKTEIRAPFDGVTGLRYVSEGAVVNATTRIGSLQQIDPLKIEFSVPEKYAGRIAVGTPISFRVAGQEREFTGRVYVSDSRIDPTTRTVLLRGVIPNPDGALVPGASARVKVTIAESPEALMVPAAALVPDADSPYVFVAREGRAVRLPVVIGVRTDSSVQVLAGLEPGETVITSGLQQLRPGSPVEVELSFGGEAVDMASAALESSASGHRRAAAVQQ